MELIPSSTQYPGSPDVVLTFDGGSRGNPGWGYGSYLVQRLSDGAQRLERLDLGDNCTSNEAEYDTLITALQDLIRRKFASRGQLRYNTMDRPPAPFACPNL